MSSSTGRSSAPETPSYADRLAEEMAEAEVPASQRQAEDLPADRFLDRESSWLDFNSRVLALACDEEIPLLERVRFLAIFATNLDEFFMVRVAGLIRRLATGIAVTAASGLSAREQLQLISARAHELVVRHARVWHDEVAPALSEAGIDVVHWDRLTAVEQESLHTMFRNRIYPVLTPLAVDPAHPFPYISGLSLNLAVVVRDRETGTEHFARVKVPRCCPGSCRFPTASASCRSRT